MIKIAYITKNLKLNGIGNVVLNQCKHIDRNKFNITIYSGDDIDHEYLMQLEKLGIKVVVLPSKKKKLFRYIQGLKNELEKNNYDVLCVHGNSRATILELMIGKFLKIKNNIVYAHSTSTEHKIFHKLSRVFFNIFCDKVIACSYDAAKFMGYKYYTVIPNGFDVSKYVFSEHDRNEIRRQLNINSNETVIGHVGLFNKSKNQKYIVDVFEKLRECKESYKLLLVGYGKYFDEVEKSVSNSKYKDDVILYGKGSSEKLLNAMDVFVFPSLYEGLGLSLVEAQINGLPSIASENIPKEAIISDNCEIIKLADKDKWLESLCKEKHRTIINSEIYMNYDIKNSIKKLEKEFLDIVRS